MPTAFLVAAEASVGVLSGEDELHRPIQPLVGNAFAQFDPTHVNREDHLQSFRSAVAHRPAVAPFGEAPPAPRRASTVRRPVGEFIQDLGLVQKLVAA